MDEARYTLAQLKPGMRAQCHPATDAWMMGDRWGDIVKVGTKYVHVKMDRSEKVRKFLPWMILQADFLPNSQP